MNQSIVILKDAVLTKRTTVVGDYTVDTVAAVPKDQRAPLSISTLILVSPATEDFEREKARMDQIHSAITRAIKALG